MMIAVASGKGGTGKTSVATNLACNAGRPVLYADCDVEEPNAHIFFDGQLVSEETASLTIPVFDLDKCNGCSACADFCQFNALAMVGDHPLLFPELCHGCGGCLKSCPHYAVREEPSRIGSITTIRSGDITLMTGRLDIGNARASSLVHILRNRLPHGTTTILDAPPGTACQTVATLRGVDYVVLVTEPTPFGLHDLKLAVALARALQLPFGVVINRNGSGDDRVHRYCTEESIALLLEIPDDRRIAEAYSQGEMITRVLPEYQARFRDLWRQIDQQLAASRSDGH